MSSTAEWLDRNLQGRGSGQELPYDADVKWNIRQHLLDLVAEIKTSIKVFSGCGNLDQVANPNSKLAITSLENYERSTWIKPAIVEQNCLPSCMTRFLFLLSKTFPTLSLYIRDYTHTNGRVVPLFVAEGTLPMFYQGVKYNIPIAIWLPEKYPRIPPIMYVVPTHDMVIKPRHSFVTPSGVVNSEYLRNWTFRSSLEVLGHDTSIHFSEEPPLFQKPPNAPSPTPSPPPPQNRPQQSPSSHQTHTDTFHNPIRTNPSSGYPGSKQSQGYHASAQNYPQTSQSAGYPGSSSSNNDSSLWGGVTAAANSNNRPQENRTQQSPDRWNPPKPKGPDLKAIFREAAIKTLSERLTASIASANEQTARETDQLFNDQAELGRRSRALDDGLKQAQNERAALEGSVVELTGKTVALDRWITENESKAQQEDIDPDTAIVASDILSRQALDAQAEDLALEDTLYSLNKGLQEGIISAESYMKQVRNTCYKQFFVRALGTQVAQKQQDLRRINSQRPPPSVQMTQGDLWSNPGLIAN